MSRVFIVINNINECKYNSITIKKEILTFILFLFSDNEFYLQYHNNNILTLFFAKANLRRLLELHKLEECSKFVFTTADDLQKQFQKTLGIIIGTLYLHKKL
jgi:hypothetical protein